MMPMTVAQAGRDEGREAMSVEGAMGIWKPLNRAMVVAAGMSVLAACYAVAAWGQVAGNKLQDSPTVTVASLSIPRSAWRHFEKANAAAQRHRTDEFDRESAEALEIAPNFAAMYLLRATVEVKANEFEAAIVNVEAARKVDPSAMWTTVVLAGAYNGMHRFRDALLVLNAKHGFESQTWQAMYERARAEVGSGDIAAALRSSAAALNAAPREFSDAHLVRANALMLGDRLSEAASQMDIYLQSKGPQMHHDEVVAMRDEIELQIREQVKEQPGVPSPIEVALR